MIPRSWNLPASLAGRLGDSAGRQRCMAVDGHLLLVLHQVPRPGENAREARLFWRAPDGRWDGSSSGAGIQALLKHLEGFVRAIEALEGRLATAATAAEHYAILQEAAPLARTSRNLHRVLQEAREACPGDRELLLARDRAVELERAGELLHHDAVNGMQYMLARQAEEQARAANALARAGHRLNLLAALFLPLMALATAFGMNLSSGLEERSPLLFWLVVGLSCTVGVAICLTTPRAGRG
jgi:Mg2+ and Co2+ transporter CorA